MAAHPVLLLPPQPAAHFASWLMQILLNQMLNALLQTNPTVNIQVAIATLVNLATIQRIQRQRRGRRGRGRRSRWTRRAA